MASDTKAPDDTKQARTDYAAGFVPNAIDPPLIPSPRSVRREVLGAWTRWVHPIVKLLPCAGGWKDPKIDPDCWEPLGSCFAVAPDKVVTANHVLQRHFKRWLAREKDLPDEEMPGVPVLNGATAHFGEDGLIASYTYHWRLLGIQNTMELVSDDVVVLTVPDGPEVFNFGFAPLASELPREGDPIYAAGFPFGMRFENSETGIPERYVTPVFSFGIISKIMPLAGMTARNPAGNWVLSATRYIIDANVEAGMSGGPVIDAETGCVVGVCVDRHTQKGAWNTDIPFGFGTAAPTYKLSLALSVPRQPPAA